MNRNKDKDIDTNRKRNRNKNGDRDKNKSRNNNMNMNMKKKQGQVEGQELCHATMIQQTFSYVDSPLCFWFLWVNLHMNLNTHSAHNPTIINKQLS